MGGKRKVEVFSAGCAVCEEAIDIVERVAGPFDEVLVHDMKDPNIARRAKSFGIRSVPAVVIDGKLADFYLAEAWMNRRCAGRASDSRSNYILPDRRFPPPWFVGNIGAAKVIELEKTSS